MRVTQEHTFLVVRCRVGVRAVGGRGCVDGGRGMTRGNLSKPWRRSHESAYSRFYQTCRAHMKRGELRRCVKVEVAVLGFPS